LFGERNLVVNLPTDLLTQWPLSKNSSHYDPKLFDGATYRQFFGRDTLVWGHMSQRHASAAGVALFVCNTSYKLTEEAQYDYMSSRFKVLFINCSDSDQELPLVLTVEKGFVHVM